MSIKKPKKQVKRPNIARTTQANYETREPSIGNESPEAYVNETETSLPKYQAGCPECEEHSLVTEQKIHSWRVCRCRVCDWRGEMEG